MRARAEGQVTLVTGGVRSGKSHYAEQLALSLSDRPVYVATARVLDGEMEERVRLHRARRGDQWESRECPLALGDLSIPGCVAVVDCLTMWITNHLCQQEPRHDLLEYLLGEFDRFTTQPGHFIFVTNEVGSGGIASNALARQFADLQGRVNAYAAKRAQRVVLMVCGIPLMVKS